VNEIVRYVLFQCMKQRLAFAVTYSNVWATSSAHDLCDGLTPDEFTDLVTVLQKVAYGQYGDPDMPVVQRWSDSQAASLQNRRRYLLLQPQPWVCGSQTIRSKRVMGR
jgi:hypothetical protein